MHDCLGDPPHDVPAELAGELQHRGNIAHDRVEIDRRDVIRTITDNDFDGSATTIRALPPTRSTWPR